MAPTPPKAAHPTPGELRRFLLSKLGLPQAKAVVAHLLRGCAACQQEMAPLAAAMFRPERDRKEPATIGAEYDFAIRRAEAAVYRELRRQRRQPAAAHRPAPRPPMPVAQVVRLVPPVPREPWAHCEALLEASHAERHEDPEMMLWLAAAAMAVAETIDPAAHDRRELADLQARALAAVGNARRVMDDPLSAEDPLRRAVQRAAEGTGDPLLRAHLADLTASLRIEQRRFREAERLLEEAGRLYQEAGEKERAAKAVLTRSVAAGYEGDSMRAMEHVLNALVLLDPAADPELTLGAVHNLLWFLVDCGHAEEAWDFLWFCRGLYAAQGDALLQVKLTWLEGRVAHGRGHRGRAERSFRQAREEFLALKLPYTAAMVSIDLAILLLERGCAAEARGVIQEAIETFDLLHIKREAAAGIILLAEALRQNALTITVLERAAAELRTVAG